MEKRRGDIKMRSRYRIYIDNCSEPIASIILYGDIPDEMNNVIWFMFNEAMSLSKVINGTYEAKIKFDLVNI